MRRARLHPEQMAMLLRRFIGLFAVRIPEKSTNTWSLETSPTRPRLAIQVASQCPHSLVAFRNFEKLGNWYSEDGRYLLDVADGGVGNALVRDSS